MKALVIYIMLCLCLTSIVVGQTPLPKFFESLYDSSAQTYSELKAEPLREICEEFDIAAESIRSAFLQIDFYHDLFTGTSATNCSSGGILKIPYFWHWVTPNPRHSIRLMPDSVLLTELKPPAGFSRYKSYADVDRTPSIFLGDLMDSIPMYFHPGCGTFYTFGWCSEREMAFCALLKILGFKCKVKQSGIHTWSEVWIGQQEKDMAIIAEVDNTFDFVRWRRPRSDETEQSWAEDFGRGNDINWYNSVANSEDELERLRKILVSDMAAKRIQYLIDTALRNKPD